MGKSRNRWLDVLTSGDFPNHRASSIIIASKTTSGIGRDVESRPNKKLAHVRTAVGTLGVYEVDGIERLAAGITLVASRLI